MKKQNGFIATSLLYTFFLAFIGLFMGMIVIYLQNRVYLNKLEDSSKNSIYIREIKDNLPSTIKIKYEGNSSFGSLITLNTYENNIFQDNDSNKYNLARCEIIYKEGSIYYIEGCPTS